MDRVVGADGGVRPAQARPRRNYVLGLRPVRNNERVAGNRVGPCYLAGMSAGGEGDPTKSDDEADIDTIELMLRPEEFARLESIWEAQTSAPAASRPATDSTRAAPESDEDAVTGPFDVTRLRSEYSEGSEEPPGARTDSTAELPALRLTSDGRPMAAALAASGDDNGRGINPQSLEPTIALPALRLTPEGKPVSAAVTKASSPSRTHFQYASKAPRDPSPRAPLSVEQFVASAAPVSKPAEVERLTQVAPIFVEPAVKASTSAKEAPRQQARWPWVALSSVGTALVFIIAWLFTVDGASVDGAGVDGAPHTEVPAVASVAAVAPVQPAQTTTRAATQVAAVSVPVSTTPSEPRTSAPRRQHQSATAPVSTVKFANPFDQNEVFEFPAGTTRAEARDAVAEILMQRARERQGTVSDRTRSRARRPGRSAPGAGDLVENSPRVN
jgi:hypothetical protein